MSDLVPHTKPIFIKSSVFPPNSVSPVDICQAAECTGGKNSVFGVQKVGGIYRLYPSCEQARSKLLALGFSVHGVRILPSPTNPKRIFLKDGLEIISTRLIISNIPLSVSERDIAAEIESAGYSPLTQLSLDCLRDKSGFLTRFKNGNRSLFIVKPDRSLPKTVKIQGKFTGYLFYPEREEVERQVNVICSPNDPPLSTAPIDPTSNNNRDSEGDTDTPAHEITSPTEPPQVYQGKVGGDLGVSDSVNVLSGPVGQPNVSAVTSVSGNNRPAGRVVDTRGDKSTSTPSPSPTPTPTPTTAERRGRPRAKTVSPGKRGDSRGNIEHYLLASRKAIARRSNSRKRAAENPTTDSPSKRTLPS